MKENNYFNDALFRRSRCFSKSYLIICERKDYRRWYTRRNESDDFAKTITFYSKESIPTKLLKELPNVTEVKSSEGRFILTTEDTDATLKAIYQKSLPVTDVSVERGSLDEAFEQFVANQKEEIA